MADNTSIPIIVQGNSFSLAIPLQIYVIDGTSFTLEDYTPDITDVVSVQLKGSRRSYTYTPTITGNIAYIELGGYELADNYGVVVSIVKASGQRLRSFRTDQFFIVESSDDLTQADIVAGLEENVIYLNSTGFIAGEDGRGIVSIVKTSTSGLVDTYTITYTDNTTSTFDVTNGAQGAQGVGITSIAKTSTSGLVDTYTITLTNGNTSTFDVTNGKDGYDLGLAGIVNNLTTGGTQDALSAEMGKLLGTSMQWESVDVVNLTSIPMVIKKTPDNGVYLWASSRSNNQQLSIYRHTRIKCTKGDKFYVKANSTNPFSYAWLTSYTATYNEAAPLVSGTVPTDVAAGGEVILEAPEGAEFLYMRRSVTAVTNTELLPEVVMRLKSHEIETAVPISLKDVLYDTTTGKIISSTSSVVRTLKVKQGDVVKFSTSYTDSTAGRPIYIGFAHSFPSIGTDVTIVDMASNYTKTIKFNDYYVAPFDGYFLMSSEYGTVWYKNYSFGRVLTVANASHPLRDEKILVFGDSILQLADTFAGSRNFSDFLAEYTGATVIGCAIGGTRLVPRSSGAFRAFDISNLIHSWVTNDWTDVDASLETETSYTTIINNLKAVRPEEITCIVMDGGGNDASDSNLSFGDESTTDIFNTSPTNDTINGAINYIMRDLFTANPHLKVFWLNGLSQFAGSGTADRTKANWCDNRTFTFDGETYTRKEYYGKIYEQVSKWKVPLISMEYICINPLTYSSFFYANDNTHPYMGFYRMASIVASQLVAKMFY